jgi:transcriptional regulator with XRE-family HTH domain
MLTISARIRRARSAARLTQEQLAGATGVKRSAVAQWERFNGTSPNTEHLSKVAIATCVCFEWLATGRGPARTIDGDLDIAASLRDFAQNEFESKALDLLRRLSPKGQKAACAILELL